MANTNRTDALTESLQQCQHMLAETCARDDFGDAATYLDATDLRAGDGNNLEASHSDRTLLEAGGGDGMAASRSGEAGLNLVVGGDMGAPRSGKTDLKLGVDDKSERGDASDLNAGAGDDTAAPKAHTQSKSSEEKFKLQEILEETRTKSLQVAEEHAKQLVDASRQIEEHFKEHPTLENLQAEVEREAKRADDAELKVQEVQHLNAELKGDAKRADETELKFQEVQAVLKCVEKRADTAELGLQKQQLLLENERTVNKRLREELEAAKLAQHDQLDKSVDAIRSAGKILSAGNVEHKRVVGDLRCEIDRLFRLKDEQRDAELKAKDSSLRGVTSGAAQRGSGLNTARIEPGKQQFQTARGDNRERQTGGESTQSRLERMEAEFVEFHKLCRR